MSQKPNRIYLPFQAFEHVHIKARTYQRPAVAQLKGHGMCFEPDDDCPLNQDSTISEGFRFTNAGQALCHGMYFHCLDCPYVYLLWEVEAASVVRWNEFYDETGNTVKQAEIIGHLCPECKYKRDAAATAAARPAPQKLTRKDVVQQLVDGKK